MSKALQDYIDAKADAYRDIEYNYSIDYMEKLLSSEDEEDQERYYAIFTRVIEPEQFNDLDTDDPEVSKYIDQLCTGEITQENFCKQLLIGGSALLVARYLDKNGY